MRCPTPCSWTSSGLPHILPHICSGLPHILPRICSGLPHILPHICSLTGSPSSPPSPLLPFCQFLRLRLYLCLCLSVSVSVSVSVSAFASTFAPAPAPAHVSTLTQLTETILSNAQGSFVGKNNRSKGLVPLLKESVGSAVFSAFKNLTMIERKERVAVAVKVRVCLRLSLSVSVSVSMSLSLLFFLRL